MCRRYKDSKVPKKWKFIIFDINNYVTLGRVIFKRITEIGFEINKEN